MIIATLLPNNADRRMQHPEPMIRLVELVLMLTQGQYGGGEDIFISELWGQLGPQQLQGRCRVAFLTIKGGTWYGKLAESSVRTHSLW